MLPRGVILRYSEGLPQGRAVKMAERSAQRPWDGRTGLPGAGELGPRERKQER